MGPWTRFFLKALEKLAHIALPSILDWAKRLPEKVLNWWNGKKISVIGPIAVGKNSFYLRLQEKAIPDQHVNTKSPEDVPQFSIERILPDGKRFSITVKRSINVGGEKEQRDRFWLDACRGADIIFYMLTITDLREKKYVPGCRISDDLVWLSNHIGKLNGTPRIHFLVNKVDLELKDLHEYEEFAKELGPLINDFASTTKTLLGDYSTRVTGISPISMLDESIFNRSFALVLDAISEVCYAKS